MATRWVRSSVPNTVMSNDRFQSAKSASVNIVKFGGTNALLTSASMRPNSAMVVSTRRWACTGSAMSVGHTSTRRSGHWRAISFATACSFSSVRETSTTSEPSRANTYASSCPSPGPMPEMIETLWSSIMSIPPRW